ncbi:LacI family DNA-binding transcriptional regulator [Limosilactobacillus fermentum]|uniref:LacI family DNA-binding transcriptional regulator n=1 Tax=Limosilactobacillus fermentum TaxID=1613 RepID=UPI000CE2A9E5|nr:hypothetical protein predicted by Glimmer/Critica [Limosilactobacillus fermentum]
MKSNPKHESGTVTIQMIAKLANVSHTTVSRALNGSDSVKPATKKRLLIWQMSWATSLTTVPAA